MERTGKEWSGQRGHRMKQVGAILFILAVAASPAFAEKAVKIDLGGGIVIQDLASKSGGGGPPLPGIFGTLGLFPPRGGGFPPPTHTTTKQGVSFFLSWLPAPPSPSFHPPPRPL